jgi:hypothetical protein
MGPRLRRDDVVAARLKDRAIPDPTAKFCDIITGFVLQRAKTNVKAGI